MIVTATTRHAVVIAERNAVSRCRAIGCAVGACALAAVAQPANNRCVAVKNTEITLRALSRMAANILARVCVAWLPLTQLRSARTALD